MHGCYDAVVNNNKSNSNNYNNNRPDNSQISAQVSLIGFPI